MTLKDKPKFYLLNKGEDQKNPVVRALVQTPTILDYKDMDLPPFEYTPEAIMGAIDGLQGYQVEDETHKGTSDKSFATVVNTGWCPDYGGFVDLEVFKPEYHDLMRNLASNIENGIPVRKGFSTEVDVLEGHPADDGHVVIDRMKYDGLIWTKTPRDTGTGICSVLLNKIDDEIMKGSDLEMTDEDMVPKQEFEALQNRYDTLFKDYETGKEAHESLRGKYDEGKTLYMQAQESIESLEKELEPIRAAEEEARVEVLNKIVEDAPEDTRDEVKAILENKSREELEVFAKLQNKAPKGVVTPPPQGGKIKEDDLSFEEAMARLGREDLIK